MYRPTAFLALCLACLLSPPALARDLPTNGDTWVDGSASGHALNFNESKTIRARKSGTRFGLLRWDFQDLPSGTATMLIRVNTVNVAGEIQVRMVTSPWRVDEVTFDSRPSLSPTVLSALQITPADVGKTLSFDVSGAVAAWRNNPSSNNGLAVTATGSPAEVYFFSREGGTAAILHAVNPPVIRDNDVTVGVGEDYADPVIALENALSGDNWCVSRSPDAPCRLHLAFGFFPVSRTMQVPESFEILGIRKHESVLFALPGVTPVLQVRGGAVRTLGVLNEQATGEAVAIAFSSDTGQPLVLDTLLARANSPTAATALRAVSTQAGPLTIQSSELTAVGRGSANPVIAVHLLDNASTTLISASQLSAVGGQFNFGLEWESRRGLGDTTLENTSVVASGFSAVGVHANADDVRVVLNDGEVTATGDVVEAVISNGATANLLLSNMKIVAQGTQRGDGILALFNGPEFQLHHSSVDATSTAVAVGNQNNVSPLLATIHASSLAGRDQALAANSASADNFAIIEVDESSLRGATALNLTSGGAGTFVGNVSLLVGAISNPQGMVIMCTGSFDENGNLRRRNCFPQ